MDNTGDGPSNPIYESGLIGNNNKISAIYNNQDEHKGSVTDAHAVGNGNTSARKTKGLLSRMSRSAGPITRYWERPLRWQKLAA